LNLVQPYWYKIVAVLLDALLISIGVYRIPAFLRYKGKDVNIFGFSLDETFCFVLANVISLCYSMIPIALVTCVPSFHFWQTCAVWAESGYISRSMLTLGIFLVKKPGDYIGSFGYYRLLFLSLTCNGFGIFAFLTGIYPYCWLLMIYMLLYWVLLLRGRAKAADDYNLLEQGGIQLERGVQVEQGGIQQQPAKPSTIFEKLLAPIALSGGTAIMSICCVLGIPIVY